MTASPAAAPGYWPARCRQMASRNGPEGDFLATALGRDGWRMAFAAAELIADYFSGGRFRQIGAPFIKPV